MRYRMIGIDLDGTLLDSQGRLSERNRAAVAAAQAAGVLVVPCTGRAWRESRAVLEALPTLASGNGSPAENPGVFVGGAAVSDLATGRTLDIAVIEPNLAYRLVQHLYDNPEAVLVFRDANLVGHDYLVTGRGTLTGNTQWWFEFTGATVHFQRDVLPADLHHTLRVGLVTVPARMAVVTRGLVEAFGSQIFVQSFAAVSLPDPRQSMHVLEVFACGVDKWRGLQWVANRWGIDGSQVAVIGDQINDVAMVQSAGCGIAMGNAIDVVKSAARYVTGTCDDCGVAEAIEHLLAERWT